MPIDEARLRHEQSTFALRVGNGAAPQAIDGPEGGGTVEIPFMNSYTTRNTEQLIADVNGDVAAHMRDASYFAQRPILTPKHVHVRAINQTILDSIPGIARESNSIATVGEGDDIEEYPTEFLNSVDLSA